MDTLGIEPNTSRMLSERDNQLHHVPHILGYVLIIGSHYLDITTCT